MKYYLFICGLVVLLLTGCVQKEEIKKSTSTETLSSSVPEQTGLAQFSESELFSGTYLGGIYMPIFISGNTLVVSGVFSFDIPKEIVHKIYSNQYTPVNKSYYERVGFTNKDKNKTFNLNIYKLIRPETTYSDKDLCKVEYFDGFITKSEKIKNIQGKNIYIYYATLMSNGLDVEPTKIIDTHFCFVDSGMLYKFSASNYTHSYIDQIIESIELF